MSKLATQPEEPYVPSFEYQLKDGRTVTIGVVDSKGRYGWVFKDTLEPVTDEDIESTPQTADDVEDLIEKAINGNMTITDPVLYDEVYSVASTVADALTDILDNDVYVMNEARIVLQAIKDTDPGMYDEMIDKVLRLISEALDLK